MAFFRPFNPIEGTEDVFVPDTATCLRSKHSVTQINIALSWSSVGRTAGQAIREEGIG